MLKTEIKLRGARGSYRKRAEKNRLTNREQQIYSLIACDAYSNRDIANFLGISINTVKTHIENIFTKKNINNRLDLAVSYYESEGK